MKSAHLLGSRIALRGNDMYLIETKVVHSSAFPALLTLLLSTTWIWWRLGICWLQARVCVYQPPRSQDCEKLGGRLGTTQHIRLGAQVSEIQHVFSVKKPERSYGVGLNGVGQLLHKVSHLLYEVGQLLWEVHLLTAIRGCGRQVYKTFDFPSLQPALILQCRYPM